MGVEAAGLSCVLLFRALLLDCKYRHLPVLLRSPPTLWWFKTVLKTHITQGALYMYKESSMMMLYEDAVCYVEKNEDFISLQYRAIISAF